MPSGWDIYYVLFLSAALALVLPVTLALISYLMTGRDKLVTPPPDAFETEASEEAPLVPQQIGRRINTRIFLSANIALLLIIFGLTLIPCVGMLQPDAAHASSLGVLGIIFTLAVLCGLGLLYASRKGDLNWLSSFNKDSS